VKPAARRADAVTSGQAIALATGRAGDVYLCHPFLVHAAQSHRGRNPRFLAQPPLYPIGALDPFNGSSPVEIAMRVNG
jgi:hypothetical protein